MQNVKHAAKRANNEYLKKKACNERITKHFVKHWNVTSASCTRSSGTCRLCKEWLKGRREKWRGSEEIERLNETDSEICGFVTRRLHATSTSKILSLTLQRFVIVFTSASNVEELRRIFQFRIISLSIFKFKSHVFTYKILVISRRKDFYAI